MSPPLVPIEALAAEVRRRNREIALEAAVAGGMGVFSLVLTMAVPFALVASIWWRLARATGGPPFGWSPVLAGLVAAGLALLLAGLVAWQLGDGFDVVKPFGPEEVLPGTSIPSRVAAAAGHGLHEHLGLPLLASGPNGVLEAVGLWRHRHPTDDRTLARAAALLARCASPVPIDAIDDTAAYTMLRRLQLLRTVRADGRDAFTLSERGERILRA